MCLFLVLQQNNFVFMIMMNYIVFNWKKYSNVHQNSGWSDCPLFDTHSSLSSSLFVCRCVRVCLRLPRLCLCPSTLITARLWEYSSTSTRTWAHPLFFSALLLLLGDWLMGSQPQWAESSYFGILLLLSVIAERAAVRLLFVLFEVIARWDDPSGT